MLPTVALAVLVFTLVPSATPQSQPISGSVEPQLGISRCSAKPDLNVPSEYLISLQTEVVKDVEKKRRSAAPLIDAAGSPPEFVVNCEVTKFNAGSRTKRILATGFGRAAGVGATRMTIHLQVLKGQSGQSVLDTDVEGSQKGTSSINPGAAFSGSDKIVNVMAATIAKTLAASVPGN